MTSSAIRSRALPRALRSALCVLALAACVDPTRGVRNQLQTARDLWQASGITSYHATISRECACAAELTRAVTIVVRNGVVTSRAYVDTGAEVAPAYAQEFPTVDALFTILENAAAQRPASMTAAYDAVLGYPVAAYIDFDGRTSGDEVIWRLTDFGAP